jgi:hypothetical protein
MIDPTQFESALLNLVVNARDAMSESGQVDVAADAVALADNQVDRLPAGRYVRVVVRDSGTGMTPETMTRAVEPFFTTKEVGKGTGLGLSQVYGMMQQCQGALALESCVGEGTTVSLYFPAVSAEAAARERSPAPARSRCWWWTIRPTCWKRPSACSPILATKPCRPITARRRWTCCAATPISPSCSATWSCPA